MTLCAKCHRDRPGGGMVNGEFQCGSCNPAFSAGQRRTTQLNPWAGRTRRP